EGEQRRRDVRGACVEEVGDTRQRARADERTVAVVPDQERQDLVEVPGDEQGEAEDEGGAVGGGEPRGAEPARERERREHERQREYDERCGGEPHSRIQPRPLAMTEEQRGLRQERGRAGRNEQRRQRV